MSNLCFLMLAVSIACLVAHSTAQVQCTQNTDCYSECQEISHAVCDVPSGHCHCHDHGEITCSNNNHLFCQEACPKPNNACCHNDHHCHCTEPCGKSP